MALLTQCHFKTIPKKERNIPTYGRRNHNKAVNLKGDGIGIKITAKNHFLNNNITLNV